LCVTHKCVLTRTHTCVHTHAHTDAHTYTHAHIHARTHTCTHTYTHTHARTHTRTHTHTAQVPLEYRVLGYNPEPFPGLTPYAPPLLEEPLLAGTEVPALGSATTISVCGCVYVWGLSVATC